MAVLVTAIHDFRPHPRGTGDVDTRPSPGMTGKLTHDTARGPLIRRCRTRKTGRLPERRRAPSPSGLLS
jgi:hypothetical protein